MKVIQPTVSQTEDGDAVTLHVRYPRDAHPGEGFVGLWCKDRLHNFRVTVWPRRPTFAELRDDNKKRFSAKRRKQRE